MSLIRNGMAQFNLPVGKHAYRVEAPFYEEYADTLELTDSTKLLVPVVLQSFYSYLTVRTPMSDGTIYLNGQPIGKGGATSGHLQAGSHRLQVMKGKTCYYDSVISVSRGEKKIVNLAMADLHVIPTVAKQAITPVVEPVAQDTIKAQPESNAVAAVTEGSAKVTITAPDDTTEIWVNREPMAYGKWEGELALGYYKISTRKDGLESKPIELWVDDTLPKILDLKAPQASYGLLNIHCNVVGATVFLNDAKVGMTPCVLENLPDSKPCRIRLVSDGYKNAEAMVVPIGNDMVDVNLIMKRE